jgi:uncharacterized protein YdhG (YjbR/CyaY superfamily)
MAATRKSAAKNTRPDGGADGFTAEERSAMNERAKETKSARSGKKIDGTAAVLEKIAAMADANRLITAAAPELTPRTWYGMPAYARDGKVVCFFYDAAKFEARYATLGFQDAAHIDGGAMWPTSFALTELTPATEKQIVARRRVPLRTGTECETVGGPLALDTRGRRADRPPENPASNPCRRG